MKKLALFLSVLILGISFLAMPVCAAENITVDINNHTIIVDGTVIQDTVLVYDGSFYVPPDAVSYYLQTPVKYYKTNSTYYIGDVDKISTEEVPTVKLTQWRKSGPVKKEPAASTLRSAQREVSAWLDPVKVKVNGRRTNVKTIRYNKIIYIQLTPIAKTLGKTSHFYGKTATLYIGKPPAGEVPDDVLNDWKKQDGDAKSTASFEGDQATGAAHNNRIVSADEEASSPPASAESSGSSKPDSSQAVPSNSPSPSDTPVAPAGIYDIAADGDYAGWRLLLNHPYAESYNIYFRKTTAGDYEIAAVPLFRENLYEAITLTSSDQVTETLTRGQWYSLFRNGCAVRGGEALLRKQYGDFFDKWYRNYQNPEPLYIAEDYIQANY